SRGAGPCAATAPRVDSWGPRPRCQAGGMNPAAPRATTREYPARGKKLSTFFGKRVVFGPRGPFFNGGKEATSRTEEHMASLRRSKRRAIALQGDATSSAQTRSGGPAKSGRRDRARARKDAVPAATGFPPGQPCGESLRFRRQGRRRCS